MESALKNRWSILLLFESSGTALEQTGVLFIPFLGVNADPSAVGK